MLTITPSNDPVQNTSLIANAIATVGPNGVIHFPNMMIPHNGIVLPYPVSLQGEGASTRFNQRGTILHCMDNTNNNVTFPLNSGDCTNGATFSDLTLYGGFWGLDLQCGSTNFTLERVNVTAGVHGTTGGGGIHCGHAMERLFWKNVVVESGGTYGVLFDEANVVNPTPQNNGAYVADSHFDRLWIIGGTYGFVMNTPNSRAWDAVKWTLLRLTQQGSQPFFSHTNGVFLTFDGVSTELPFQNGVPAGMLKSGMMFKTTTGQGMGQIVVNGPDFSDGITDIPIVNVAQGGGAVIYVWQGPTYSTLPETYPANLYIPPL